jgi:hypothetical protein
MSSSLKSSKAIEMTVSCSISFLSWSVSTFTFANPFLDLAKYPGDVRKEISRFGKTTAAQKFNEQQMQKMQFIQQQRSSGLGGFMSGMSGRRQMAPPTSGGDLNSGMQFNNENK